MDELVIETTGLAKTFGTTRALDGLDLAVPRGSVFGVLGPNGAGKTTAIRVLATLLAPDGGAARVLGHDVVRDAHRIRGRVSLTGQFASVDEDLTGAENLVLLARLHGLSWRSARARAAELLERFDLAAAAGRQVRRYSGGMRRRLDIAGSLITPPELLFLDEPTTGLDPLSRNNVWEIVRSLAANGTTVLLTTQYLDEADQLADRIAVIDHGRVIAEGSSADLKASVGAGVLRIRLHDARQRASARSLLAPVLPGPVDLESDPRALSVRLGSPDTAVIAEALHQLARHRVPVTEFALGQPSLDEVFLTLTGHASTATDEEGAA